MRFVTSVIGEIRSKENFSLHAESKVFDAYAEFEMRALVRVGVQVRAGVSTFDAQLA